ncbi:uncharacterized protein LOC123542784 [Mercenaria mercenaria]|uniref:uncharacterized protein LOC123542784 n=1 Tax=Mercenaria mercenaria TaxID=6596 RepID=UPI00234FAE0E|nr:uncharacterized protein LOC123542784 [Mercenaria mercenaria]
MFLTIRRMSFSRLAVLLISMSLILYLFYDFMSFQSKPTRGTNLLQKNQLLKMQALRDRVHYSTSETEVKEEPIGKKVKETSSEKTDDKNNEELTKHEASKKVSGQKNENRNDNVVIDEERKEVETDDEVDASKSTEKQVGDNDTKTKSNHLTDGPVIEKSTKKKLNAYRKAMEYEEHLKDTNASFIRIINRARYMSSLTQNSKIVLLSFVCKSCLPFLNSWLCNTKEFGIHKSVLLLVRELKLRRTILTAWPDLNVVAMQPNLSKKDYTDNRRIKNACSLGRVQLINALLHANVNLLLFDLKSVWLENPMRYIQQSMNDGVDILVNTVPRSHLNTGFLALFATEKTQLFWKEFYGKLRYTFSKWTEKDMQKLDLDENYEDYLEEMVEDRYEAVAVRHLPIHSFTDGVWYYLSEEERAKTRPVVIRNNYVEGNEEKIRRAKQWTHWFLQDNGTCNVDIVKKTVRL